MVDYFKAFTSNFNRDELISRFRLDTPVDIETGEIKKKNYGFYQRKTEFKGLRIVIIENNLSSKLEVSGSAHKYYNNGEHNYNDFKLSDFIEVINNIAGLLCTTPQDLIVSNLEFGVNIDLDFEVKNIVSNMIQYQNKKFVDSDIPNSLYRKCVLTKFKIKAYDKSLQYSLDIEKFRFELKYKRMWILKELLQKEDLLTADEISLFDLCNRNTFDVFSKLLIEKWNDILLYNFTIDIGEIKDETNKASLYKYQNFNFWGEIKYRQLRLWHKRKFQNLMSKYAKENVQKLIADKILDKTSSLTI